MQSMKPNQKKQKSPTEEYDPVLTFRLPVAHRDLIVREAEVRYLKESDILREIVREWVEKKTGRV